MINPISYRVFAIPRLPHYLKGQGMSDEILTIKEYYHAREQRKGTGWHDVTFVTYESPIEKGKLKAEKLEGHITEPKDILDALVKKIVRMI
jgi:hypothetical protein